MVPPSELKHMCVARAVAPCCGGEVEMVEVEVDDGAAPAGRQTNSRDIDDVSAG